MGQAVSRLGELRVVPIVEIESADRAGPLADALLEGGLPILEITLRTDAALEALARLGGRADLLLGAGTVLTVQQARHAVDAGARFLVTPGVSPPVIEHCLASGIEIVPGVATPTDVQLALALGVDVLKFFPAQAYGGVATLKALSGPFPQVRFVPTGGVTPASLGEYLAHPKVLACGGSWMAKRDAIRDGRWDEISRLAREAVRLAAVNRS